MKKLFNLFLIATMAVAMVFVGCKQNDAKVDDDDDDNGGGVTSGFVIDAKNIASSSSNLVKVEASVEKKKYTATYSNKSFKLTLPNNISGIMSGRHSLFLAGLNKAGDWIGLFSCSGSKGGISYYMEYSYATENMVYTDEYEYDWNEYSVKSTNNSNLKKGWNIEYCEEVIDESKKTVTFTTTTNKPAGVTFAWEFYSTE